MPATPWPRVAAVVLAAGAGTRMGGTGKLLVELGGRPLVFHALEAASAVGAAGVVVVIGHDAARVRSAIAEMEVALTLVENAAWRDGIASSLRVGLRALPPGVDGVVILLGDMPRVRASHVERLIGAFADSGCRAVCVPVRGGRRGNPVLWPPALLPELAALEGDTGGRALLGRHAAAVQEVEMPDDAVLIDVDAPADLACLAGAGAGATPVPERESGTFSPFSGRPRPR